MMVMMVMMVMVVVMVTVTLKCNIDYHNVLKDDWLFVLIRVRQIFKFSLILSFT